MTPHGGAAPLPDKHGCARVQGLGKTVQTVAFLSHLRQNGINGPFLVVVPLSTIVNWQKEVTRWCPSMKAIIFHGTKADRQAIEREWFRPAYSRAPPSTHNHPAHPPCRHRGDPARCMRVQVVRRRTFR